MTIARLEALHDSVTRLAALVEPLDDATLDGPAYPSAWSIADVCSHLGSGAVILGRRVADALTATPTDDGFPSSVWAEWDAKEPRAKADDGLEADGTFLSRLASMTDEERGRATIQMGPLSLDFAALVAVRLNEHVLHTWDVEVALDPLATLPATAAALVVDEVSLVVRYTGRAPEVPRRVVVALTDTERHIGVDLGPDAVALGDAGAGEPSDLSLPTESFVRLLYGRLDASHTPSTVLGDVMALDALRAAFPGP